MKLRRISWVALLLVASLSAWGGPTYDGRGKAGSPGADGHRGASGSGSGGDGGRGGNAVRPDDAEHSKSVTIEMEEVPGADGAPARFRIVGSLNRPDGATAKEIKDLFEVNRNGYIVTDKTGITDHAQALTANTTGTTAHGGRNGGRGGDGATGYRGSDATRYSSGGNGGPGGDGGDGGLGTDGGNSGNAADTVVTISEDQTHLLMHFEETQTPGMMTGKISGGAATAPGSHGHGGSGGSGGAGGSSYSWTTTTTHTRTNSQGQSETYTETHYHSNPGGSSGRSGSSGRTPTAPLSGGSRGKDANFVIRVKMQDGRVQEYRQGRYDISIVQKARYESSPTQGISDGLIEPDEPVEIHYVVKNESTMPTPKRIAHLRVLDSQGVVVPDQTVPLEIPALQPGETFETKPKVVMARSVVNLPVRGDAIIEGGQIRQRVVQTGTGEAVDGSGGREYKGASAEVTPFEIQQAVRLSNQKDIRGAGSLAPGEETWLEIQVHNNSPISETGSQAPKARRIVTSVKFDPIDGLTSDQIETLDASGKPIDISKEVMSEHLKIPPGGTSVVKIKIRIRPGSGTKAYSTGQVATALSRGPLKDLMGSQTIQIQDFKIQTVKVFEPSSKVDVVLVTNSDTPRAVVEGIKKRFAALGKVVEDYNLSYYGALDVNLPPLSRLKDGRPRTLLVLDNPHGVHREQASYYSKVDQSLEAARRMNLRTMFVGPNSSAQDVAERLRPVAPTENRTAGSARAQAKAEKKGTAAISDPNSAQGDTVDTRQRWIWGTTQNHVNDRVQDEAGRLLEEYPEQKFLVVANTPKPGEDIRLTGRGWKDFWIKVGAFFRKRPAGSYTLVRGEDRAMPTVSQLRVSAERMATAEFAESDELALGYLKQLPFAEKIETLNQISAKDLGRISLEFDKPGSLSAEGKILYGAILSDLAEEQDFARGTRSEKLEKLRAFVSKVKGGVMGDEKSDFVTSMFADLQHMLNESRSSGPVSESKSLLKKGVKTVFGDYRKEAKVKIEAKVEEREKNLKALIAQNKETAAKAIDATDSWRITKWFKKKLGIWPERAEDGRALSDALHFTDQRTFIVDAHIASGGWVEYGQDSSLKNEVVSDRKLAKVQESRQLYAETVDRKVAYNTDERVRNTGTRPAGFEPPQVNGANCNLSEVYRGLR